MDRVIEVKTVFKLIDKKIRKLELLKIKRKSFDIFWQNVKETSQIEILKELRKDIEDEL